MKLSFGKILKQLREEKNITQPELANAIGISKGIISLWENEINEPKISYVQKLANYFNVSAGYLLGMEDELGNPIKEQDLAPAMAPTVPKTTKVTMAAKSKGNKVKNLTIELTEEQLAALLRKLED